VSRTSKRKDLFQRAHRFTSRKVHPSPGLEFNQNLPVEMQKTRCPLPLAKKIDCPSNKRLCELLHFRCAGPLFH
jgi:hypothetical protein